MRCNSNKLDNVQPRHCPNKQTPFKQAGLNLHIQPFQKYRKPELTVNQTLVPVAY